MTAQQQIANLLTLTGALVSGEPIQIRGAHYPVDTVTVTAMWRDDAEQVWVATHLVGPRGHNLPDRLLAEIELIES